MKNANDINFNKKFDDFVRGYTSNLMNCFSNEMNHKIFYLAKCLGEVWKSGNNVFLCGNGGSAGNAIHIANDFIYGVGNCGKGYKIPGIRVSALSANPAILTCLGNDIGFENIFSYQLKVQAKKNDLLIALSGSGNSPNVISAINTVNQIGLKTFAILAFDGGKCNDIANYPLHFNIDDMQIAEDLQLIIGHLCMQWLSNNKSEFFG